jgi:tetratricopeptide (TPR) repeat protein
MAIPPLMRNLVFSGLIVVALVGCATVGTPTSPAPEPVPASAKPVVLNLMRDSTQSLAAGRYPQAALALEQALRIEPRNAWLWHELAKVRVQQQRYHQAVQLAAKSNALSRDQRLHAANWLLIADAHESAGDLAKAQEARERANRLDY